MDVVRQQVWIDRCGNLLKSLTEHSTLRDVIHTYCSIAYLAYCIIAVWLITEPVKSAEMAGGFGHFGRGASLYRHRSQLFGRLWVRLPLPTGQFSEI